MSEGAYKQYLLVVLMVVFAFSASDGLALGLALQSIKADLSLKDTQLGFLSGIAFSIFYSLMGLPIAAWADRGNRARIIALSMSVWGLMVALCGRAASFTQLLLIRIGVATGEAGCMPPAQSLIPDYFQREERPRAVAIYMLGQPASVVIGYFCAGWVNQLYGWRIMFAALGASSLVPAGLAWFTLKEPRRTNRDLRAPAVGPGLRDSLRLLWSISTFKHLLIAFSLISFFGNGIAQWQPAFFIRHFGLQTGELGTWLAAVYGIGGSLGTYWGGQLASRFAPNNERLQLKAMAIVFIGFGVVSALIYLSPNHYLAFALAGFSAFGATLVYGPLFAAIQTLVPPRMRALSVSTIYLVANLIGIGLGPLAVGTISDQLQPWAGNESLRIAMLAFCPGYAVGAWQLWKASKTVNSDLRGVRTDESYARSATD